MPPSIRYATSPAGARIAYSTLGEGPPVVFMPPAPFSHIEALWGLPGPRRWFEGLARGTQLALYDAPGTGMSERGRGDFRLDAQIEDLEAVTEALGWREFALCGFFNAAPPAIAYAAAHPRTVTDLVLWGGFAAGTSMYPLPLVADAVMAAAYWDVLLDTASRAWTAGAGDEARQTAAYFRACVDPVTALQAFVAAREYDVRPLLSRVEAPTLVVHRRDATSQRLELAQEIAAGIRGAQLAVLPGEAASPFSGDIDAGVRVIERFLGVGGVEAGGVEEARAPEAVEPLTAREEEVLRLLARGLANKELAAALGLSVNTVERHVTNLYAKIGCRSRSEATAYALTHGYA